MRNALFRAICKVGIFVICAQAVVHFRPREAYEKYLKLLVGIMVMIQLFLPIAAFFLGGNMEQLAQRLEGFQEELEQNAKLEAVPLGGRECKPSGHDKEPQPTEYLSRPDSWEYAGSSTSDIPKGCDRNRVCDS